MSDEKATSAIPVNRRDLISGTAGVAAAGMLATLPGSAAAATVKPAGDKPGSSPMGVAFETETGNRIYSLPRDHAMHHGDWYKGAEYQETNYFTGFFKDKKTGKPYSVFFCWSVYGWDKKLNRPIWVSLFSMTDIERKKFVQCVQPMSGPLTSRGSGPDVADDAFFAEYAVGKGADGNQGAFSYQAKGERWRWMADVPNPTKNLPNQTPFFLDLRGQVAKPGYHCPVPYGFTQEGAPTNLSDNLANPFTGAALSWYIIAPCQQAELTLRCADMDLELEGQIYHEHQWGRIRIPGMEQARYFWGWARMQNGDILNWRTYRDVKTGAYVPSDSANRFNIIRPDGSVQYFMGPAFTYEPTKIWKSPETGVEYPVYGKMTTPVGVFYVEPLVEVAEAQLLNGGMWEGAARLRKDTADGPFVGRSFIEFMWAPFDSAVGKDIPYNPSITARRDTGLPSSDNFAKFIDW